jgi:ABC transporter substrate binding protein
MSCPIRPEVKDEYFADRKSRVAQPHRVASSRQRNAASAGPPECSRRPGSWGNPELLLNRQRRSGPSCLLRPWGPGARAQSRLHRVGLLFPAGETPGLPRFSAALRELGYVDGRNVGYDVRAAGADIARLPELAREVVAGRPDVIVSATARAGLALMNATREIPIVLALVGDPVGLGLTSSMARPTGNVTGFTTAHDTLAAKRLELLLELVPAARKVAFLWLPGNEQNRLVAERTRDAAAALRVELLSLPVATAEDVSLAIAKAEAERAQALLIAPDPLLVRNRQTIIDECLLRNLPAMHNYSRKRPMDTPL